MKKLNLVIISLLFSTLTMQAQNRLLHYWHFNNTLPVSGAGGAHFGTSPMNADYSKPGINKAYLRYVKLNTCYKDTGYWDNGAPGDTTNQRIGIAGCCPSSSATSNNSYVRMRNPSDSMQMLMYMPTKNFKNIVIKYSTQASSTNSGQHRQNFDYSLDSGSTFITANLPRLFDSAGTGWGKVIINLSASNAFNNSNKLIFRIRFGAPNTGTSGNNRFDNITVEGDSIVNAATNIVTKNTELNSTYVLIPNPATHNITIKGPIADFNISLMDAKGQEMPPKQLQLNQNIDITSLLPGLYYFKLVDRNTGKTIALKFIKT